MTTFAIVYTVCLTIFVIVMFFLSYTERKRLIELIAAKDYADYKNFEIKSETKSEHKNMFTKRERRVERLEEME